ncbi:MAG TPA: D-alanyl-D-alanine carboxypeptidase family protein [Solirubrobacterales bacterium]|nr:D-alanyl-D-alanine carboxypeptidase family protein [Solirubrobacterales bacterium]
MLAAVRSRGRPRPAPVAIVLATLALALAVPVGADAAERPPRLDASAWLLVDRRDEAELATRAADARRAIASATKLMTAHLALTELRMGDRLTVPDYQPAPAESVAGLAAGERLTVRDLVVAMMLPSANDAAVTVADGVAGSQGAFVEEMNRAARKLGLTRTHYANPIGLDAPGNYSTANDLVDLSSELLGDRRFRRIVAMPKATLTSGDRDRTVTNTNTLLLSDPSVDGVKTGHTSEAGYVLVASAKRHGVPLLAAVLGTPSEAARDAETERLLDYGFSLYDRAEPVERDAREARVDVRYEDEPLPLLARHGIAVRVRDDQDVEVDVERPVEVEGPIDVGDRLGSATVTVDGRFIDRTPLTAAHAIAAPTIVDRVGGPLVAALIVLAVIVILALAAIWLRRRTAGYVSADRDPEERLRTRDERIRRRSGDRDA